MTCCTTMARTEVLMDISSPCDHIHCIKEYWAFVYCSDRKISNWCKQSFSNLLVLKNLELDWPSTILWTVTYFSMNIMFHPLFDVSLCWSCYSIMLSSLLSESMAQYHWYYIVVGQLFECTLEEHCILRQHCLYTNLLSH